MSAQPATFSWGLTTIPAGEQKPKPTSPFAGPKTMRKTIPWRPDEMVQVDGFLMGYDLDDDGHIQVCMPGGDRLSIESLRAQGHIVALPKSIRTKEYL